MPTWVIVGASRGIGYQYLKTLSSEPSNTVIGIARTIAPVEANLAKDNLQNVHIIPGDLTDSASLYAAAEKVSSIANGTVDYLVVNGAHVSISTLGLLPGACTDSATEALLLSELDICMRTNVMGALYSINAFMRLLLKSDVKKVVCISSGAADTEIYDKCDMKDQLPYCMSKAALNVLVAKFAAQYRGEGVKFLALSPGYVLSIAESLDQMPPQLVEIFDKLTEGFKKINPDLKGPVSPKESVGQQLKVIENLTLEHSGEFLSHLGNKQWV
ncbi:NAD(P)-binding protein [Cucurbitaria berberidis CBS 394.84]|uniref:NAD(P)-binding protein n=1 Tax=Cucurbitaria berberidis CBS 394.84 TaxID=1168544 RepID=A0A9P4LD20_9PLEO|nr:NAD(P)-binding protein [Cucurbitaria berberidis CBS 394.84]KAF1850298.1 NAD(P)-binding protein [Cucurbitaria berberidis CBS 394.84]